MRIELILDFNYENKAIARFRIALFNAELTILEMSEFNVRLFFTT